ncbi:hypothetical protein FGE12_13670 [Aggregicoccus sp. 17bor-14]|uniref:hypothetical protein n=1 Tax=Myxococcaceae TaxID=31 RepID=UPI00129C1862|nr:MULTISPECIES: hypothetical protein [Myxococcaceae]MBF5043441.1 hypothetical protein [Simulacricoccus sp. 17bor-14]MRI89199.1 hypothetical protein [Aggregicoccus sp. 17bor-14]
MGCSARGRSARLAGVLGSIAAAAAGAVAQSPGLQLLEHVQGLTRSLRATRYRHEGDGHGAQVAQAEDGSVSVDADCSGWVSYQLQHLADPRYYRAVLALKDAEPQERHLPYPRAYLFWRYLSALPPGAPYARVARLADLRPGDLVAWCLGAWCEPARPAHVRGDTGHLLIVAAPPAWQDATHAFVLALDASSLEHYGCDDVQAALAARGHDARARAAAAAQDAACRSYPDVRDAEERRGGAGAGYIRFEVDGRGVPVGFQFAARYAEHPVPGQQVRFALARLR